VKYGAHLPLIDLGPPRPLRIFVWPLGDEPEQLELFRERVISLVVSRPRSGTR
jgi:hypothetical protein